MRWILVLVCPQCSRHLSTDGELDDALVARSMIGGHRLYGMEIAGHAEDQYRLMQEHRATHKEKTA